VDILVVISLVFSGLSLLLNRGFPLSYLVAVLTSFAAWIGVAWFFPHPPFSSMTEFWGFSVAIPLVTFPIVWMIRTLFARARN
jgi:hypothetical protein